MGNIAETIIFEQMSAEDLEPLYINGIPVTPDEQYRIVSEQDEYAEGGGYNGFETEVDLDRDMPNPIYIDSEEQKISQESLSNRSVNDEPQ